LEPRKHMIVDDASMFLKNIGIRISDADHSRILSKCFVESSENVELTQNKIFLPVNIDFESWLQAVLSYQRITLMINILGERRGKIPATFLDVQEKNLFKKTFTSSLDDSHLENSLKFVDAFDSINIDPLPQFEQYNTIELDENGNKIVEPNFDSLGNTLNSNRSQLLPPLPGTVSFADNIQSKNSVGIAENFAQFFRKVKLNSEKEKKRKLRVEVRYYFEVMY